MRIALNLKGNKKRMAILKRGRLTYYIKEEAIIVGVNNFQFTGYTVYSLQNRKPFYDFREAIMNSKEDEYDDVFKLISLALKHNLRGVSSHRPTEYEMEKYGYEKE